MKTFVSATYTPTWLSCSGTYRGVPKDWSIWEDIVGKVYARYKTRVDWLEAWNEIENWHDLRGSPYTNQDDFLVAEKLDVDAAIGTVRTAPGSHVLHGEALSAVVVGDQSLERFP